VLDRRAFDLLPGRRRGVPALVLAVALLTACSDEPAPAAEPDAAETPPPSAGQQIEQKVQAELDGVPLELEVADEPRERGIGLMGRTEVPPGTGMVFLFDQPSTSPFYMFDVPVPLVAAFVREGVVVGVEQMAPCAEADPAACPLYGPDEPYDTVVETAPETLPGLQVGARLEPASPGG
jgi:uncharacterized membrane protein (UPF0127 family)